MKKSLLVLAAACAVGLGLTVTAEMTFDRAQLALEARDGMTVASLGRYVSTWEVGAPALPIAVAQLVVPPNMKVIGIRIEALESETIPGAFSIYPVQPAVPLSATQMPAFVPPDPQYYGASYPGQVAVTGHQGSMSGYNIASAFVAPVRYNGADQSLVFHPRVRFALELEPADLGYLRPGNRSAEARRRVEAMVAGIVLNPEDVAACAP